jgi:hypothetical protein
MLIEFHRKKVYDDDPSPELRRCSPPSSVDQPAGAGSLLAPRSPSA